VKDQLVAVLVRWNLDDNEWRGRVGRVDGINHFLRYSSVYGVPVVSVHVGVHVCVLGRGVVGQDECDYRWLSMKRRRPTIPYVVIAFLLYFGAQTSWFCCSMRVLEALVDCGATNTAAATGIFRRVIAVFVE